MLAVVKLLPILPKIAALVATVREALRVESESGKRLSLGELADIGQKFVDIVAP